MLGLLAAQHGLRVIVAELGEQGRLTDLFGIPRDEAGGEIELDENLFTISIDPDRALMEWLQSIGGPVAGRMLSSSSTFQYFAAAAPGAKELVSMIKMWELTRGERWRRRAAGYDLVILDAPATGHALGMLHSPWTFGSIARVGPIAGHTRELQQLLEDPARSGYVAVSHASEMAVSEVLAIQDGLRDKVRRELDTVIVNEVLPRRFSEPELQRIDRAGRQGRRRQARKRRGAHARGRRGGALGTRTGSRAAQPARTPATSRASGRQRPLRVRR